MLALSPSYTGIIVLSFLTMEHLDLKGKKSLEMQSVSPKPQERLPSPSLYSF